MSSFPEYDSLSLKALRSRLNAVERRFTKVRNTADPHGECPPEWIECVERINHLKMLILTAVLGQ